MIFSTSAVVVVVVKNLPKVSRQSKWDLSERLAG